MLSNWQQRSFGTGGLECFDISGGAKQNTEKSSRNNKRRPLCHPAALFPLSSSYCVADSDAILGLSEMRPPVCVYIFPDSDL